MHVYAWVIGDDVDHLMCAHQIRDDGIERWDFYQIGGRWTGILVDKETYDPMTDPCNKRPCTCVGGDKLSANPDCSHQQNVEMLIIDLFRSALFEPQETEDGETPPKCQKCSGTGVVQKWPIEWARYEGDITTVGAILARLKSDGDDKVYAPGTYITETGWCQDWTNEKLMEYLETQDPVIPITVVDYHC